MKRRPPTSGRIIKGLALWTVAAVLAFVAALPAPAVLTAGRIPAKEHRPMGITLQAADPHFQPSGHYQTELVELSLESAQNGSALLALCIGGSQLVAAETQRLEFVMGNSANDPDVVPIAVVGPFSTNLLEPFDGVDIGEFPIRVAFEVPIPGHGKFVGLRWQCAATDQFDVALPLTLEGAGVHDAREFR